MVIGGIRLPNSCVRILGVLRSYTDGLSQQQIRSETRLSERAVKYAVKELVGRKLASSSTLLNDTRRKLYYAEVGK